VEAEEVLPKRRKGSTMGASCAGVSSSCLDTCARARALGGGLPQERSCTAELARMHATQQRARFALYPRMLDISAAPSVSDGSGMQAGHWACSEWAC